MTSGLRLIRVGYWRSPEDQRWPDPAELVDPNWDPDERSAVCDYLQRGFVARAYLGKAACKLCGEATGSRELSDGVFIWPEGLAHYVGHHSVRLPMRIMDHVKARAEELEDAEIDDSWWLRQSPDSVGHE